MPSPLKSESKSELATSKVRSLQLVPHENNAVTDYTPMPLAISDPEISMEACLTRRSPRFSVSPVGVSLQNVVRNSVKRARSGSSTDMHLGLLENETCQRRSSRLHPGLAGGSGDGTGKLPLENCKLLLMDDGSLRRSPRFNVSGGESGEIMEELCTRSTTSKKRKISDSGNSATESSAELRSLRRSPRFDSINRDERKCGFNQVLNTVLFHYSCILAS